MGTHYYTGTSCVLYIQRGGWLVVPSYSTCTRVPGTRYPLLVLVFVCGAQTDNTGIHSRHHEEERIEKNNERKAIYLASLTHRPPTSDIILLLLEVKSKFKERGFNP